MSGLWQREDAALMGPQSVQADPYSLLGRHVGCWCRPLGLPCDLVQSQGQHWSLCVCEADLLS